MTVLGLATAGALALVPLPAVAAHFGRVMAQLVAAVADRHWNAALPGVPAAGAVTA
jgi:hypothetical protein